MIGLYLNPADRALVLCCDEKSHCQALERTQPGLPLGIGHIRTRTHDYYRHATVTLFAASSYLDGRIFSLTEAQHTHRQWLVFLKTLDRETPPELTLHLIVGPSTSNSTPASTAELIGRPRGGPRHGPAGARDDDLFALLDPLEQRQPPVASARK